MSRKGENIYKRKDGRWEGRYIKNHTVSGKAVYGYVYAATYREAKEKLAKSIAQKKVASTSVTLSNELLFEEIARAWLSGTQAQVKESSGVKYENMLNTYILSALGKKKLSDITHNCIDMFCTELLTAGGAKKEGLSPKTVTDILSIIRRILSFASMQGYTPPCDARLIKVKQTNKPMCILSRNEQSILCDFLIKHADARNVGILLCLFTGIRIGELCALQWEDISLSEKTIYVHQTMQRIKNNKDTAKTKVIVTTPKSGCSIRTIPLPSGLVEILRDIDSDKHGFFLTGNNRSYLEPRVMQNQFKRVLARCGIEAANFHALRHTFATRCVELGFDSKTLSEILGHASVTITMNRYVHPTMELKRDNMQRLSSLIAVK